MNDTPRGPRRIEDRPSANDETISRLLRVVGPRREVPEDAVAQAREAARAEWRRKVKFTAQRRRFRRLGGWLAMAAAAVVAIGLVLRFQTETAPSTQLGNGADYASLLFGEASVRLDKGSGLHLVSSSTVEVALRLERGAVYIDSPGDAPSVVIRTPLGEVRDVGTQFEVRVLGEGSDRSLRLRVREGKVFLDHEGSPHDVEAGTELTLEPDGTPARRAIAIYGSEWDWVLELAPALDIEGKPLSAFLDWLCREGGWTLRWADQSLARKFGPGTQYGSIEGLTPLEAAEFILPSNGLGHRLEDGVFTVVEPP